jgi:hypothetical protein
MTAKLFDPRVTGLTQSLLQKWIICRERFRILTVEGLKEARAHFDAPLEFGDMFHAGMEAAANNLDPQKQLKAIDAYTMKRIKESPSIASEATHWNAIAKCTFAEYQVFWGKQPPGPKVPKNFLFSEQKFNVKYPITSKDKVDYVRLRGKFDAAYLAAAMKMSVAKRKLNADFTTNDLIPAILMENKTKGDFKPVEITQQLTNDLQTMWYLIAMKRMGYDPRGILYNVIRRTRLHYRKNDSTQSFVKRVRDDIRERPTWYFYREFVPIAASDITRFEVQTQRPILRDFLRWWDEIATGKNPYTIPGHFLRPFGIYDGLSIGAKGDYFSYVTARDTSRLKKVTTLYSELE